jgi:hypothetical protein
MKERPITINNIEDAKYVKSSDAFKDSDTLANDSVW